MRPTLDLRMRKIIIAEPSNDAEAETVVITIPVQLVLTVTISTRGSLIASLYNVRWYEVLSEVIIIVVERHRYNGRTLRVYFNLTVPVSGVKFAFYVGRAE